jgi:uncharacterized membrane-anchored protein
MKNRRLAATVIVAGQLLLILGLIGQHEYRKRAWRSIRLQVQPVDPVSLFRGRYVNLGYHFSSLETKDGSWRKGEIVYLHLTPDEKGHWRLAGFGRSPEPEAGALVLQGRVEHFYAGVWRPRDVEQPTGLHTLTVKTGLESYFLSERKAPEIERLLRDEYEMTVEIAVADDGRAVLKQLFVRGVPAEDFEPD